MNRRDFFRGVGAAAASLALDPVPSALAPYRWEPVLDARRSSHFTIDGLWSNQRWLLLRDFAKRDYENYIQRLGLGDSQMLARILERKT